MALVIKHLYGGNIQYQPFTPSILNVLDVRYNTQVLIDYLKDESKRKKYTNDYRGFNLEQTNSFNKSLDNYIKGIEDGKIVFSNDGLTKLTRVDGVDPTMEPYIREYFNSSVRSGLIPMYNESYKDTYKVNLDKVLSRALLGEEVDSTIFNPAWLALDSKDEETLLRGIQNRRAAYAKALRAEANKLENDSEYRKKFKFPGWENDLNAYKKIVQALRAHADEIEKVNDFEKDESWIQRAASVGLSAGEVRRKFFRGEADESGNEVQHEDGFDKLNIGFLMTEDPTYYSKNKKYTINDDYENLPEEVKAVALLLLLAYDRKQIKSDWYYWENYVNKYLENLTPHFSNLEVSVYSVSNGPISNLGKKFFIRRKEDLYPSEVELIKNADGTYTAHNDNTNINLGQYTESEEARAARTYDAFGDLGLPISINLAKVLKDTKSINDYFNYLILNDTRHMNPKMFSNILMYLSAWLWNRPDGREYTNFYTTGSGRNWYGSSFEIKGEYNKPSVFIWKFRNYGLKFEFTKPNNFIKFGDFIALNPKNIKSVTIDYASRLKSGGKLRKFLVGGLAEYIEYLKKYGLNRPVLFDPIKSPKKTKEEQREDDKYNLLVVEGEPTTADKVRFAAATTDLLSSFLVFPKGTNIAALTGTGLSFLGYLTADAIDVVNGKLPAADTLLNDAKLAAVMAMPLFINPTKAKALGAGERMLKLAGMAAKYVGTAFALGQIATQEQRDDILRSWGKITNPTKMDAHDLTNIAFTLRLVAGGREHVKNFKNNRQLKKALKDNQTGQIDYKVKVGDKETTSSLKVNKGDALDKESVIQRIIDENKALELKPEQITILNKIKKASAKERIKEEGEKLVDRFTGKNKEKTKEPTKETSENKQENAAESTSEESKTNAETPKSESNEIVHVDWKNNKTSNPNIEYEEWIPNRAFLYATKENGNIVRNNTKFGGWLRGMFGPNWDLVYSDYRLVKGYRLGKINLLNKGLFTTLDLFRKQGKELEEIRLSTLEGEAKNTALLTKLKEFGYNTTDTEAALAKANEIADFYVSDLSKYDNLQIAQMMYDKDRQMGIFGRKNTTESKTKKATEEKSKETEEPKGQTEEQTPKTEDSQQTEIRSKFNPDNLEYINEEDITPELLLEAYKKFLEEKSVLPTDGNLGSIFNQIMNSPSRTKDERRALIGRVFESFNIENTKMLMLSQESIVKKLMKLPEVKNKIQNGQNLTPQELDKALKKLLDKNELSAADYAALTATGLSRHEIVNSTPSYNIWVTLGLMAEEQKGKQKNNGPATNPTTGQQSIIDKILPKILDEESIKENIKNNKRTTISQLSNLLAKYYNEGVISETEKDLMLLKNSRTNNLHYTQEGSAIIEKIREQIMNSVNQHMYGGTINFARRILTASTGAKINKYLYGGGIQFKGDWYDDFFLPGISEVTNDLRRLLENKDGEFDYLFNPEDENSIYSQGYNYYNLRKKYDNEYANSGGYYEPEDESARNYQMWIYKHFPSLLRINTNLALKNGKYYKGDKVITDEFLPEGVEYTGDNKVGERTRNLHLGNSADITDPQKKASWLKWLSDLLEEFKDKYTFYIDNVDGSFSIYSNDKHPEEGSDLTTLLDYISNNNIDLTSTSNPSNTDDILTNELTGEGSLTLTGLLPGSLGDGTEEKIQKMEPLPAEWFALLPKDNLTWARVVNTLFGNAATFAIRNKYKPLFTKDLTYLDFKRVFRDTSAIDSTNQLYGLFLSRQQGTSSDMRQNVAVLNDLMSKYNTAMLSAEQQNKTSFDTTYKEAQEAAKTNSLNLTNTYNANIKKYTDEQRLLQEYDASALKIAGDNVTNLFAALIQEKGNDNLYAKQHYLNSSMLQLQGIYTKAMLNLLRFYYNKYLTRGGNSAETVNTFYSSPEFERMTDLYDEFNTELLNIQNVHRLNVETLYGTIYSTNLFRNNTTLDINPYTYGGLPRPNGVKVKNKQGGKILMAKQGGASVNWVRVENARMINKLVNTAMKETYKSLRQANSELQKTIRAMEPLIRKLNRRDSVKLL